MRHILSLSLIVGVLLSQNYERSCSPDEASWIRQNVTQSSWGGLGRGGADRFRYFHSIRESEAAKIACAIRDSRTLGQSVFEYTNFRKQNVTLKIDFGNSTEAPPSAAGPSERCVPRTQQLWSCWKQTSNVMISQFPSCQDHAELLY